MKTITTIIGGLGGISAMFAFMAITQNTLDHYQLGVDFQPWFIVWLMFSVFVVIANLMAYTWVSGGLDDWERQFDD